MVRRADWLSGARHKELVRMVVDRVKTRDRAVVSIAPVPAAAPFFAPQMTLRAAPPDGLGGTVGKDALAWYAMTSQ